MQDAQNEPQLNGVAISDVSIKQPVFVTMVMLLLVVAGFVAYRSLPVNYLPDTSIPILSVSISYPGAGPQSVAEQIVKPVEQSLNTLSGVSTLSSTANEGSANIRIEFAEGTVVKDRIQDVREKVSAVAARFPDGAGDPVYQQFDPNSSAILQVAISSKDTSVTALKLRQLIDDSFVPDLERIEGVGSVSANGGATRQVNVQLDLAKLQAYGITPAQVSNALSSANTNIGLGSIDTGTQTYSLRTPTQLKSITDIANLPLGGTRYRVSDVATVTDGIAEKTSYARLNGQDAVSLGVVKQSGSNTQEVGQQAKAALDTLFAQYPSLNHVITNDQSTEVQQSVDSSIEEMILAVIAAMLVVLLFFRDIRNTLVTMAGLPVIMICTFGGMWLFGISINIISLLALSLAVGLVIDDAIVVRENIFRYMEHGYSPMQAASKGTAEVALSVVAMTLTIIAVFLPVAFTSGITGFIFKAFGITVASAMAISLVEAFTFAPMLSANLFKNRKRKPGQEHVVAQQDGFISSEAEEEVGALGRWYERILQWSLRHRYVQIIVAVLILVGSVFVATGLKVSFLPSQVSNSFSIGITTPAGTSLAVTDGLARQAEAIIQKDSDVLAVQSTVGGQNAQTANITVRVSNGNIVNSLRERLRPQLAFLPGITFSSQSFQGPGGTGVTNRNIQAEIRSNGDLGELVDISKQVQQVAKGIPGLVDIGSSYTTGNPEVQINVNPAKSGTLNLNNNNLATTIRALVSGNTATSITLDGDDVNVVVRLATANRNDINALQAIGVPTANGTLPLGSIADISSGNGPTSLRRTDLQYEIVVGANVGEGQDQSALQQQLSSALNQLDVPSYVTIQFGGNQRNQSQGFSTIFLAMGLSLLFVYMVLASQFGSFLQPFVIMLAMPFSFLGAFVALRITNLPIDITAMIGLVMLLGLVVKNSILLVDFTNRLRRTGTDKHVALARAGAIRLRPILMTSTAIIAGALPTAMGLHFFSSSQGSEFRRGLATVLIGGMITSTLLTLLVIPTAYSLLDSMTSFFGRLFHRRSRVPAPVPAMAGATAGATGNGAIHSNGNGAPQEAGNGHTQPASRKPYVSDTSDTPVVEPQTTDQRKV